MYFCSQMQRLLVSQPFYNKVFQALQIKTVHGSLQKQYLQESVKKSAGICMILGGLTILLPVNILRFFWGLLDLSENDED